MNDVTLLYAIAQGIRPKPESYHELAADHPLWSILFRCWRETPEERPTMVEARDEVGKWLTPSFAFQADETVDQRTARSVNLSWRMFSLGARFADINGSLLLARPEVRYVQPHTSSVVSLALCTETCKCFWSGFGRTGRRG